MATHSSNNVITGREVTFLFIWIFEQIEHMALNVVSIYVYTVNGHIS